MEPEPSLPPSSSSSSSSSSSGPDLAAIRETTDALQFSAHAAYRLLDGATAAVYGTVMDQDQPSPAVEISSSSSSSSEFMQIRRQDVRAAQNEINNIHRQVTFLDCLWTGGDYRERVMRRLPDRDAERPMPREVLPVGPLSGEGAQGSAGVRGQTAEEEERRGLLPDENPTRRRPRGQRQQQRDERMVDGV